MKNLISKDEVGLYSQERSEFFLRNDIGATEEHVGRMVKIFCNIRMVISLVFRMNIALVIKR